jgi:DNA-binding IclR family transcriptional regulator
MGRPALAASRAVEILALLAARPTQSFTLTEIAGQLDLSPASCHALMKVLSEAGYVSRHPAHKSYELGPALVAIGHAALERHRAIDLARDEVRRLADDLHIEAIASAPIGSELIVLARAGRPRHLELLPRIGQRLPIVPPIGAVFIAWEPEVQIESWLDRSDATGRDRAQLRKRLGQIRDRGYEIVLESPTRDRIAEVLTSLAISPHAGDARASLAGLISVLLHEEHYPLAINDNDDYDVNYCMAPAFGPRGQVVLGLTLLGFPNKLSGAELRKYADALVRCARLITLSSDGMLPVAPPRAATKRISAKSNA